MPSVRGGPLRPKQPAQRHAPRREEDLYRHAPGTPWCACDVCVQGEDLEAMVADALRERVAS
jgi:hypothetical protein